MPTLRKRALTLESPVNTGHQLHNGQTPSTETKVSLYEQSREERIKENRERMLKLGLFDLSLKINSAVSTKRTIKNRNTTPRPSPALSSGPVRRSSRLQNVTLVSYVEVDVVKKGKPSKVDVFLEEGSKPEFYTEEHEKLLGNTQKSWTLFVDGYGKDGKRIYDPVRGKTCHQCRQKTLGYRTHCSICNMVQGQFCGDCLYMRYGEHVLEALQNSSWICPVCRGVCNCSLCRQAKGWPPTGPLYKKISKLGFKSVAHYLIETRRLQPNLDQNVDAPKQVSAKRSLPFSDIEIQSKGSIEGDSICAGSLKSQSEVKSEDGFKIEKENTMRSLENPDSDNQVSARKSLPFSHIGEQSGSVSFLQVDHEVDDLHGLSKPQSGDKTGDQLKAEKEKEPPIMHEEHDHGDIMGSQSKLKKRALPIEPNNIAGRLRQRHRKGNGPGAGDEVLTGVSEKISDVKQAVNDISSENNVEKDREMHSTEINKHDDDNIAPERGSELKRKPAPTAGPSPESIAGRLRSRRKTA